MNEFSNDMEIYYYSKLLFSTIEKECKMQLSLGQSIFLFL